MGNKHGITASTQGAMQRRDVGSEITGLITSIRRDFGWRIAAHERRHRTIASLRQLRVTPGGNFPFWEVYRKIDGQFEIRGHGTRDMPIWGDRFRAQAGGDGKSAQSQAAGRILSLVFYLQHIQE